MRYLLTLCLCLLSWVAQSASLIGSGIVVSGSPDYNFQETCESTGSDETWGTNTGQNDFDNTSSPIRGGKSLYLTSGAVGTELVGTFASSYNEGYFSMSFNMGYGTGDPDDYFIELLDASDNRIAAIRLWGDDLVYTYYNNSGSTLGATEAVTGIRTGTTWYIGVYYKAGASDAEYKFWFSTTSLGSSWGTADQTYTGKASSASISKIEIVKANTTGLVFRLDDISQSDTAVMP